MAAIVQRISPDVPTEAQPAIGELAVAPKLVAHPLQALLCDRLTGEAELLIHAFAEALDGAVQALMAESRNAMEVRAVMDLGNSLAMTRPALIRGFMVALKNRFDPLKRPITRGIFDLERSCLLPSEEMEENIALTHLCQLAEQKAGEDGRQLLARLQWAARDLALPALSDALGPQTLPDCFAHALRNAGLSTTERVLAYRLVESHAIPGWPRLVKSALELLDQLGLRMARPLAASAAQDAAPTISAATTQTLREARASLVSGPDGALASALLRALEPPALASGAGLITALAAAWIDGLLADAELPPAFAPDLESLRLAVIKAALSDTSFFTHPMHPVRNAVDELAQQAAFTGLQGYSLAPLRLALKDIIGRISIHGQFALDALAMLPPLDPELAHQFRQQMAKDQEARRENLFNRVRALSAREIEARTLDVSLPAAARAALTRGFSPLLSTLLLRHGAASPRTRQARQLLERFVDSFALCTVGDERRAVLKELGAALLEVGLPDLHVDGVSGELEKAYAELEAEAFSNLKHAESAGSQREIDHILAGVGSITSEPQPLIRPGNDSSLTPVTASNDIDSTGSDVDPLTQLLKAGNWFRVRDYKRGDDRWLSLTGVYLKQDRVSFSGFDGTTALAMRASQFVEDLKNGLAEPLNPDTVVQNALQRLRAVPNAANSRLQSFG